MSKYRKGNYDTEEPRFVYLKIWKHMPEKSPFGLLRRRLWRAKVIMIDKQFDKKYGL